ncbi:MAG: pilin [Patescibacteria group bacterium]|nr:pilin [Patescibacteria group bacterium]
MNHQRLLNGCRPRAGWCFRLYRQLLLWFLAAVGIFYGVSAHAECKEKQLFSQIDCFVNESGILPGKPKSPQEAIGTVLTSLFSLLGVVFLVLIIYGGFLWMTARGNESQIEKAKKIITSASIGLGVVLGSYLITLIVVQLLISQTVKTP